MNPYRALAPRMVGRSAQLGELEAHLGAALGGRGGVVFVAGDAGVGKTRLLREFLARVADRVEMLEGRCFDEDPAVPYGPFVDALRGELRAAGRDAFVRRAGPWARDLGTLLPELETDELAGTLPIEAQFQKRRLFEALRHMLQPRADDAPRVLVLEDLHWADQTTQELIRYLARPLAAQRMLLVASYRSDELHRRHRLTHLIGQLARERLLAEVRLPPLSRDELAELLGETIERRLPAGLVDALYERTEGNPFYLEELLKALIESGHLEPMMEAAHRGRTLDGLELPASLSDSILSRAAELSAPVGEVLTYAAVCGRRFDFEVLLRLSGLDEAALIEALQTLVERQLVVEERGARGDRYSFRHALTREAVYEDLLGRERRLKHRAVLSVLEQLYGADSDAVIDQLAYHSLQARDVPRTAAYARRAGDRAVRMFAYRDALAHYEAALDVLDGEEARERAELYERLGHAAYPLGDVALVGKYWKQALLLYQQLDDRQKAGDMHRWLGRAAWERGQHEAAFEHLRAALAVLEAEPAGASLAMAYSGMSQLYMLSSESRQSIAWGEKALALAEQLGAVEVSAHALNNIGCALVELGDAAAGIAALERSLLLARGAEIPIEVVRASHNLGSHLMMLGRQRRAVEVLRDAIVYAERVGWSGGPTSVACHGMLAQIELALGHYEAAHEVLDRVLARGEPPTSHGPYLALLRTETLLRQGRLVEARRALDSAPEQSEANKQANLLGQRLALSGALALAEGDAQAARAQFERCIAHLEASAAHGECVPLLPWALDVLLASERAVDAARLVELLRPAADEVPSPRERALLAVAESVLAALDGRHDAADGLAAAVARFEELEAPFEAALTRRRRAGALLRRGDDGDRAEAQHELALARETFERLGAAVELEATDGVARRAGLLRRLARPHSVRDGLTPRERQVLALLARGLSNRAIAEQLVIAEKTAEVHVSNILSKLNLQSRVQAATYAVEQGLIEPLAA